MIAQESDIEDSKWEEDPQPFLVVTDSPKWKLSEGFASPTATVDCSDLASSLVTSILGFPSLHTTRQMTAILKGDKYKNKKWNATDTWTPSIAASREPVEPRRNRNACVLFR